MSVDKNSITNYVNLKNYLGITTDSEQELLEDIVNAASGIVETMTNRKFKYIKYTTGVEGYETITEIHDGFEDKLFLKMYPVQAIASIYDDYDRVFATNTLIPSKDYGWDGENGIVYFPDYGKLMGGYRGVQVKYTAGYLTSTIPYDLEQVCLEIAGMIYKGRDTVGLASKSFSDGSVAFFDKSQLSEIAKSIVGKYRRPNQTS